MKIRQEYLKSFDQKSFQLRSNKNKFCDWTHFSTVIIITFFKFGGPIIN
ncbi:hypothetical protein PPL_08651 [Heterostelium album PN500]|uniref:Uncharacterized protein n=1 Tax=Heterostelium pallidum (strain ATCC 26659 / Pp 5 / PN500) TaxID=670386 RepID=D3BJC6_HETP5|nr:hypothetical protein PPL_08651 [Heterostelium album PN500]EFA78006.1 hypothetical protein PPL_08651 [Heterostelium album PN500]|eukprot:XP_020430134.1 hypothetical protein PPL_08651 [Heterostelium album PN500]